MRSGSRRAVLAIVGDPGPVPPERPPWPGLHPDTVVSDHVIALEEKVQASWRALVYEARAVRDLNLLNAVAAFRRDLEAFLNR